MVREGVTIIIKGSSRSGMEEVVFYAALWFCVHVVWKSSKKRVHMRLRRELNVYEYFVTATFSTWMNGGAKVQVTGQVTRKVTGHRSQVTQKQYDTGQNCSWLIFYYKNAYRNAYTNVNALRISWRVCGCFEKHSTGKGTRILRTV